MQKDNLKNENPTFANVLLCFSLFYLKLAKE